MIWCGVVECAVGQACPLVVRSQGVVMKRDSFTNVYRSSTSFLRTQTECFNDQTSTEPNLLSGIAPVG